MDFLFGIGYISCKSGLVVFGKDTCSWNRVRWNCVVGRFIDQMDWLDRVWNYVEYCRMGFLYRRFFRFS